MSVLNITELDLSFNPIGLNGATAIAEALKTNKTLTKLDLKLSHIDTAGAMEIADALKVNNTLTFLDLGLNNIQHEYRRKIEKELQTKHAATHIQKIVRGHQVRIKQDTNPRTISDYLSIFIQKATNCVTKKL